MIDIKVSKVAEQIVRQFLLGQGRDNEALYLRFDVGLSHCTDETMYNEQRGLHLLYHLRKGSTYVSVFSAVTSTFTKIQEITQWNHEVTHDSGWRDIQVFSQTYFEMARLINEDQDRDGLENIAPREMSEHTSFGLFNSNLFQWVPVKVTQEEDDLGTSRRRIEVLLAGG